MLTTRRALALLCSAFALLGAVPASAQQEPQTFNAFAVVVANGTLVRSGEKKVMAVATLAGPFFVETTEGPVDSGRVACAASVQLGQSTFQQTGSGACTFTSSDGATAWGEWQCTGYELVGCRGTLKLTGGTGRLAGASGQGTMIWRPSAREMKAQMDGTMMQNINGIIVWRDFRIEGK